MPWRDPHSDSVMSDAEAPQQMPTPGNPLPQFYRYRWLDVRDPLGTWLEAQVIDSDLANARIKVHYKGYSAEKYDEWIPLSDGARLAPINTHTRPLVPRIPVHIGPGLQLDVLDSIDKWRLSSIVDVSHERRQALITYLDWDRKYDEWIDMDSYRLAPLHSHTRPKPPKFKVAIQASQDNESKYRQAMAHSKGWMVYDMDPDGNCLFRTISHQVYGTPNYHSVVRKKCMEYVWNQARFFQGYIDEDFKQYVERMKYDGEWGGEVEIRAMGEIYRRPVEIYAYSVNPRTIYRGPIPQNPPIRLSYHWNSHYNSIVDPRVFEGPNAAFLTSRPGELEDERIRWGESLENADASVLSEEERLIRQALAESRADADNRDLNEIFSRLLLSETEEAKRLSEAEEIERAILKSLQAESASTDRVAENTDDLEQARQLSLAEARRAGVSIPVTLDGLPLDDIEKAQLLSMQEFEQKTANTTVALPLPVKLCIEMGFDRSAAEAAYSLFAGDGESETVANNMIAFLQAS